MIEERRVWSRPISRILRGLRVYVYTGHILESYGSNKAGHMTRLTEGGAVNQPFYNKTLLVLLQTRLCGRPLIAKKSYYEVSFFA